MQLPMHYYLVIVTLILFNSFQSKTQLAPQTNDAKTNSPKTTKWVSSEELIRMVRKRVEPEYPAAATVIQIQNQSVLKVEVKVNKEGKVTSARAVLGPSLLRDAVVEA